MESKQCEICGKVIEGYSETHVNYLMKQHILTHDSPEQESDLKNAIQEIKILVRNAGRSNVISKDDIENIFYKYLIRKEY